MIEDREIDALVAEHVFGFSWVEDRSADYDGVRHGGRVLFPPGMTWEQAEPALPRRGPIHPLFWVIRRTGEVALAWPVVEKLNALGFNVAVSRGAGSKTWDVRGWKDDNTRRFIAHDESLPRAICLAALDALNVEVPAHA